MINLGLLFLYGFAINVGILLIALFIKKLVKKAGIKELFLDFNNLFQIGFFVLIYFILTTIIYLTYSRANALSFVWLAISTSLVTVLIPYKAIFNAFKNRDFKGFDVLKTIGFAVPVVLLVLEVALFSNVSYKKDSNMQVVSFDSALIVQTTGTKKDNSIVFDQQRQNITFDNREHSIDSFYFDLTSEVETALQIDIYTSTQADSGYGYRKSYRFNPRMTEFEYFDVKEYSNSDYLRIDFVIDETNLHDSSFISPITLRQIVINKAFPFVFNMARFALLVGGFTIIMFVIKKYANISYEDIDKIKLFKRIFLVLSGVGILYLLVNSLVSASSHYVLVSSLSGTDSGENIYYQLFLALKKGHAYLDYPASDALKALTDPYNPSNRGGVDYLWDHAYYNGKYYCYYGVAPVILVMFPIYLLSGCKYIPSVLFIQEIGTLFSIIFFGLAALELVRIAFKKVNYPTLVFVLLTAILSSLLFANTTYKVGWYNEGIYRIPYSYGLGFFFMILFTLFKAYKNEKNRIVTLSILGLAVVLLMASRPTLFVAFILVAPLLIKMFFDKNLPWKKRIIDFVPMVSIIFVGAIAICAYNYVRYESIFEFGQSYQLTVVDNTKLAYSYKGIIPTLFHFYALPPVVSDKVFPVFTYGYYGNVPSYHTYNAGAIGLVFFPLFYSFLTMPFVFKKEDDLAIKITLYLAPVAVFLLAFTTYCFAGVCPRYVVELTAISSLFCIVPTIKLFDALYNKNRPAAIIYLAVAGLFSAYLSINLLFDTFDGWREADQHGLLEHLKSIFNNYNI